jgi:ribonuclease BN (tRNA processing enzyme)
MLEGFETHHRAEAPTTAVLVHARPGERALRVAWATDMGAAAPEPAAALAEVDLFVGDGTYLGAADHGHPGTRRVLEIARTLGARRIALAHVGHWRVRRDNARRALPPDVAICRDGEDLLALAG